MGFIADPYTTAFVNSSDGVHFSDPQDVYGQEGWLFWRPKTIDNITWYVTGYWHEKGRTILLSSNNGFNWTKVSSVVKASGNDEDALVFLPDNRILITCRIEVEVDSVFGDVNAGTMLCLASPPYTQWSCTLDKITRLDGPNLFTLNDTKTNTTRVFALGRFQPDQDLLLTGSGSIFSRKYTSFFEFINLTGTPRMRYISDIPSSGDTGYSGIIIQGERLLISYYSSDLTTDNAWVIGMLTPTDIYMINMSIASFLNAADHPLPLVKYLPWDNYLIVGANCVFSILVFRYFIRKPKKK
jgi:hypothetical protein